MFAQRGSVRAFERGGLGPRVQGICDRRCGCGRRETAPPARRARVAGGGARRATRSTTQERVAENLRAQGVVDRTHGRVEAAAPRHPLSDRIRAPRSSPDGAAESLTTLETGRTPHSSSSTYRTAPSRGRTSATRSSRTSAAWSRGRGGRGPRRLGPALRSSSSGQRRLADCLRADPGRVEPLVEKRYGDSFEDTTPSRYWRASATGDWSSSVPRPMLLRSTLHGAFAGGTTRPWSATPTRRRTRRLGGAAAGPCHRPHEPVLDLSDGAGRTAGTVATRTSTSATRSPEAPGAAPGDAAAPPVSTTPASRRPGSMSSAHRFLHERADPCLFGGGQLLQREGGRPHGAVVEVRLVAEAERRVPRLNLCALWKKQTTLPSLAYAGIPYQVLGERAGALALMMAWSRSAMARSGSGISAIFASTSLSPSALPARGGAPPSALGRAPSSRLVPRP